MQKNTIFFKENFYSTRKGRIGLNTTLSVYFIQTIIGVALGTFISGASLDFTLGLNRETFELVGRYA